MRSATPAARQFRFDFEADTAGGHEATVGLMYDFTNFENNLDSTVLLRFTADDNFGEVGLDIRGEAPYGYHQSKLYCLTARFFLFLRTFHAQ